MSPPGRGVENPGVGGGGKEEHEMRFGVRGTLPDPDPVATQEWIDSILAVRNQIGEEEARRLLLSTVDAARDAGVEIDVVNTPYMNTLHPDQQGTYPGDLDLEKRLHGVIRWNAMMMVTRGNKYFEGIGGHISTYASASHAWEIGFNHFFRGKDGAGQGDHLYWQGHASPGIYARAWLEGRLTHEQMEAFRQETGGKGLSSYPHPRLMPEFWEFPTVSMGLGAMTAIHQARFNRYLEDRGLVSTINSRVWYTMGDGESDEPESLSQLSLAGREGLDNIVMTMNCNLQRLDGPVRGNSKIVQELEGRFRGAGWNVIKVLWGSSWDPLFASDTNGLLAARLDSLVDGDEQRIMTADGEIIRKDLFNSEGLAALVAHLSDEELVDLCADVGGHDFIKLHAAYAQATAHKGQPTVVLMRTIKGYGLGPAFAGRNTTHQKKKAGMESIQYMRDDIGLSFSDEDLENYPYVMPEDVPELVAYAKQRRGAMDGFMPSRSVPKFDLSLPGEATYGEFDEGTKGKMQISTTMAFVRILRALMKDKGLVSASFQSFPMKPEPSVWIHCLQSSAFTTLKASCTSRSDHKVLMKYKESARANFLEEGINEAGATSTFIASATSLPPIHYPTVPSTPSIRCSASSAWLTSLVGSRSAARGFLMGATSGRTTLNGEGLATPRRPLPVDGPHQPCRASMGSCVRLRTGHHHPPRHR